MRVGRQLLAVASFIVMVEILMIMLIINATKDKITNGLITQEFDREKNIASQVSQSLRQDLLSIQSLLLLMTQIPEIRSGTVESCNAKLDQLFPILNKKIDNIVRVDKKGIVSCAINRNTIGLDLSKDELIRGLINDPTHAPVLRRITLSSVSNRYVAGIHVPVFDENGTFAGTVGGVIYFDEFEDKYFKDFRVLDTGNLKILDDNGDVLYSPTSPETVGKNVLSDEIVSLISDQGDYRSKVAEFLANAQKNRPSFIRYFYPPAPEMIAVYYPVEIFPDRHWVVVVTVPVEEVINQLDKDSLVAGFANSSALAMGMVTIVFVTQISLFILLISRLTLRGKKNGD